MTKPKHNPPRKKFVLDPGVRGPGGKEVVGSKLKELSDKHIRIMQLQIQGLRPVEIAKEVGLAAVTVRCVQKQEIYLNRLAVLRREMEVSHKPVKERLTELAPTAVDTVEEIMTDKAVTPSTRLAAAQDTLDRAGFGAPRKIEGSFAHALFGPEDLEALRARRGAVETKAIETRVEE